MLLKIRYFLRVYKLYDKLYYVHNESVNILQQTVHQRADIRMRSHCVRNSLLTKSLLQVLNRLFFLRVDCQNLLSTGLLQFISDLPIIGIGIGPIFAISVDNRYR